MKKSLLVLLCVLGLGVASLASAQAGDFSLIQRLLNTLEGQMAELKATQPAQVSGVAPRAVTTKSNSGVSITSGDDSITGNPNPVPGGVLSCAGGATMPAGSTWQTIYCNGVRWVSTGNILNFGQNHSSGKNVVISTQQASEALRVTQAKLNGTALSLANFNGGVGVASFGANTRNYFEGKVGIGTENPTESLDLGGGNIKMGYQIVSNNQSSATNVYAICPVGKKIISGGCSLSGHNEDGHIPTLQTSKPTPDGARWSCEYNPDQGIFLGEVTATAICANIR